MRLRPVQLVGAWVASWILSVLVLVIVVWLAYFVVAVSRRLDVWPLG